MEKMKVKVIVMMVAAAIASLIASADTEPSLVRWYNGGIEDGWPTARSLKACSWNWDSEEADAEFKDGYLEVDSYMSYQVNCVANHNSDLSKGRVEHTITLIPCVEQSKLQMPDGEVKTSIGVLLVSNEVTSVVSSNYYCLAKDTTTNKWVQLEGATYGGGEITVKLALRHDDVANANYANFTVTPTGGSAVDLTYLGSTNVEIVVNNMKCSGVSLAGSCKVGSLSATKAVKGTSVIPGVMFNR